MSGRANLEASRPVAAVREMVAVAVAAGVVGVVVAVVVVEQSR